MNAVYQDNGIFKLLVFDQEGKKLDLVENLNKICGIDDSTKPITGFPYPIVTSTFYGDNDNVFIAIFHAKNRAMYYLAYDFKAKKFIQGQSSKTPRASAKNAKGSNNSIIVENSTHINFPQRCFWNEETNEIFTVFRQG